jgi:hypothetical protein
MFTIDARGLYLRETTVNKQLRSGDVACIIGGEKHHSFGDLLRAAEPAERNDIGNHLQALLAGFLRAKQFAQPRRIDRARTHGVHANSAAL